MKKKQQRKRIFISVITVIIAGVIVGGILFRHQSLSHNPTHISGTGINQPKTNPPVIYDLNEQRKLLNKFENRQTLAKSDQVAKAKILSLLPSGEQSGTIYQAEDFKIDYVSSADLFQVEIQTTNIERARQAANSWFLQYGMSQQGICDLPVQFYLSFEVMNQLQDKNVTVSPLAPGC